MTFLRAFAEPLTWERGGGTTCLEGLEITKSFQIPCSVSLLTHGAAAGRVMRLRIYGFCPFRRAANPKRSRRRSRPFSWLQLPGAALKMRSGARNAPCSARHSCLYDALTLFRYSGLLSENHQGCKVTSCA
ncbi:hypothetical protein NDU88_007683 [Pleurodeles waltl]|uniref:Uncharacterized protein n=1 Tax=Pleurodeles waltl TaxID=8319 RepID=A0AAV7RRN4_PLEWA|nr:hypothetical protein NDU88_007683 [Pleurodeles waltl]